MCPRITLYGRAEGRSAVGWHADADRRARPPNRLEDNAIHIEWGKAWNIARLAKRIPPLTVTAL